MLDQQKVVMMAIREELMQYFKGDCISRFVESGAVYVRETQYSDDRRPYYYERRERELAHSSTLFLNGVPLAQLSHNPERLVFDKAMNRSPQLRKLKKEMQKFLRQYLRAVEIGESDANK